MALVRCKECGKEVSSKADKCPHCGAPTKRKQGEISSGCGCLLILAIFVPILWIGYSSDRFANSPEGRAASAEAARITEQRKADAEARALTEKQEAAARAAKLRADSATLSVRNVVAVYAANEVAGDDALKGKWFKVEGEVDRVGKDLLGSSFVAFRNSENTFRTVQCFFDDDKLADLADLRPGQKVTIFGRGKGLMMNVLMDKCEIISK